MWKHLSLGETKRPQKLSEGARMKRGGRKIWRLAFLSLFFLWANDRGGMETVGEGGGRGA